MQFPVVRAGIPLNAFGFTPGVPPTFPDATVRSGHAGREAKGIQEDPGADDGEPQLLAFGPGQPNLGHGVEATVDDEPALLHPDELPEVAEDRETFPNRPCTVTVTGCA